MSRELHGERSQMLLLPPCVDDWIGPEHPARFVRAFVERLDLDRLGFKEPVSETGRLPYSREVLLSAWLYGYMERIRSSRQLEWACRDQLGLIWLLGQLQPDHNTLWRFWKRHRKALKRVFRETVRVAWDSGLVGVVLHAVDGTKIQTLSSTRSGLHRGQLERLLSRLDKQIEKLQAEIERNGGGGPGTSLPKELQAEAALRERVASSLERLEQADREHLHGGEPDAKMMKSPRGTKFSYNGQMVADSGGLLVAEDLVSAGSDNYELVPMLEQVRETVGEVAQDTVADGGYYSIKTLSAADEKKFRVLVNLSRDKGGSKGGPYNASKFRFDPDKQVVVCPEGKELVFIRKRTKPGSDYEVEEFRCRSFRSCPVRQQCSKDRQGRRIEVHAEHELIEKHRARVLSDEGKAKLRKRSQIAEAPFGWIKYLDHFDRFSFAGLQAARTQWSMVCTARNLRGLYLRYRAVMNLLPLPRLAEAV